jgi:hypothetical protein
MISNAMENQISSIYSTENASAGGPVKIILDTADGK